MLVGIVCRAEIDASQWQFPPLFALLQEGGSIEASELARTFNCGIGMVAIVADSDADAVIERLAAAGEQAWIIGRIADGKGGCTVAGPANSWGSAAPWSASHDA